MHKAGRNDPCPCGSGRKYKNCCLGKETAVPAPQPELEERKMEPADFERLMTVINGLRRDFMERQPHLKEYKKIRKLHRDVIGSMMNYYYAGRFQQKVDPDYVPERVPESAEGADTLFLLEADFDPDAREGRQGLCESVCYKIAPNLSCITEDYIKNHRFKKRDKVEMLQSMMDSRAGLFEVTATDSKEGYVSIKEVFTGREYIITDIGMSGSRGFGDIYLYTRIITYRGVSFGTGLSLIFDKDDRFIVNFIKREKKDYYPQAEHKRFIELFNRYTKNPSKIRVVAHSY